MSSRSRNPHRRGKGMPPLADDELLQQAHQSLSLEKRRLPSK